MTTWPRLPSVVAFGGGHGLSATLSALRRLTDRITAIVTVADDGGSSGRLRREFNCLPPGDLRMALEALCGDDSEGRMWADVLQSRFPGDGPLGGHAIGNLLIAGLWQQLDDAVAGLDVVGRLLRCRGRVLPMSTLPLLIEADVIGVDPSEPDEMSTLRGEATIATTRGQVWDVRLLPHNPPAHPAAVQAIAEADYLILGPGSWFTSVVPHLLVPELADAIVNAAARRILILNLVGADETEGFRPSKHIEVLAEHESRLRLDTVICDASYSSHDRHLIGYAESLGAELVMANVAMRDGSARHDPLLLAATLGAVLDL